MKALHVAAAAAALVLLTSCGGEEFGDLKAELNERSKDFRGRVDPLPQVRSYEPVPYTAENVVAVLATIWFVKRATGAEFLPWLGG